MEIFTSMGLSFAAAFAASGFKSAKGPGQALDDLMTIAGFEKLHLIAEKKRVDGNREILEYDKKKHSYKESIAQNISKIPTAYLQYPRPIIAGPALEISKYYLDENILRKMFAQLVASSMDSRKNEIVHPSFIEIIKQLSPFDAILFEYISKNIYPKKSAITSDVAIHTKQMGSKIVHKNLFIDFNNNFIDQELNSVSLSNLQRLGLIEINNSYSLSDTEIENRPDLIEFKKTNPYIEAKKAVDFSQKQQLKKETETMRMTSFIKFTGPILIVKNLELSAFGQNFYKTLL